MTFHPPEIFVILAGWPIRTYGVIIAAAITLAFIWAERRAIRLGLSKPLVNDVFFWSVVGGLIGARLGFVIQELDYFTHHLTEIFALWQGGLSFHGGLVGGIIGGTLLLKQRTALNQFSPLANAAAAPLLLGAAIGRLGNWANQELYGYPTGVPWAIAIDPAHRLPGFEMFTTFHPTFAYEAILNLLGLLILVFLIEKRSASPPSPQLRAPNPQTGNSFLFALAWYSLARLITEIWRIGDRLLGPFSLAQLISLGLIVGIIIFIMFRHRTKKIT